MGDKMVDESKLMSELIQDEKISPKVLRRIIIIMEFSLRTADGTPTTFATKFGLTTYKDLYEFFKKVKYHMKMDHEDIAFNLLTECWKSVSARAQHWIQRTFGVESDRDALFYASVFTMRTFGLILDNLLVLKSIIKRMDERKEEVMEYVRGQKFTAADNEYLPSH